MVSVETQGYSGRGENQVGAKPGTVGLPIPGVCVNVVNPDTLEPLRPGQEGMLIVKGPGVMTGYLDDPEINDYLNELGHRLVAARPDSPWDFQFFALPDPSVNAFALPGE